ncbi:hypothetical protein DICVIV_08418 [Dictyocaulus viviparus]|uniref:Uncharacterized protein n=1 Tax=Dictyocaulus viviparus TaxID=29172 RepID=A0A0D8XLX2_DICVI|nr:hypothetical protein DICVIV_08418 [Dictyocaulus viviparus]
MFRFKRERDRRTIIRLPPEEVNDKSAPLIPKKCDNDTTYQEKNRYHSDWLSRDDTLSWKQFIWNDLERQAELAWQWNGPFKLNIFQHQSQIVLVVSRLQTLQMSHL